jgi:hypothetical protein
MQIYIRAPSRHTHTGVRWDHILQFLAQIHPHSVRSAHPRPRPPLPAQVPRIASVCKVDVSICLCTLTCTLFSFTLCVCSLCFHVLERRVWRGGILSLFACTDMHARIHARMLAPVPCLGFSDYVAVSWYSIQLKPTPPHAQDFTSPLEQLNAMQSAPRAISSGLFPAAKHCARRAQRFRPPRRALQAPKATRRCVCVSKGTILRAKRGTVQQSATRVESTPSLWWGALAAAVTLGFCPLFPV